MPRLATILVSGLVWMAWGLLTPVVSAQHADHGHSASDHVHGHFCATDSGSDEARRHMAAYLNARQAGLLPRRKSASPPDVGDEEEFKGEAISETARRELLEETGYHAGKIEPLIVSPTSAGMTSEFTHLFLATDLEKQGVGGGTGSEDIKIHLVPRNSLRTWLREKQQAGHALDFKIHAALWSAGL